ncbi:MAG: PAS domain S-box protein [Melioribacteraceae bacterium]|nr:PAS domain S-box protein [Melioribacteraceae bacterium]
MKNFKLKYNIFFFLLLPLISFAIITLGSYHHVIILFTIPVLIVAIVFKNRTYLIHLSAMVLFAIIVTYFVSSSFISSLLTILYVSLAVLITSEIIIYYSRKLSEQYSVLLESEEKLTKAQSVGNIGHWELDIIDDKPNWSDQIYKIFEIEKDKANTNREAYINAIHPDDRESVIRVNSATNINQKNYTIEYRILKKNGEIGYVEEVCTTEFDKKGTAIRSFGTVLDITKRKEAEIAHLKSEERYKTLANSTFEGITITENRIILDANQQLSKLLGYELEEIIGKKVVDFIHEEDRSKARENIKIGNIDIGKFRMVKKDGDILFVEAKSREALFESKNVRFTIFRDITAIIENEKKLYESEERYKMLSDLSFESILIHKDGFILDANDALIKMTGYDKEELVGKNIVSMVVSKDYWRMIVNKLKTQYTLPFEIEIYKKDGTKIPVEIESRSIIYKDKKVRVVAARDISIRKKSQEHIRKLSRAVEQSQVSITITDINGNIEYVNPKYEKTSEYSKEELIGQNQRILKSGKVPKEKYKELWKTILSGKEWSGILPNLRKNGGIYWESIIISPIKDSAGKITHFVGVKEDITEKIKVEKELDMYHKNLENLVEERTQKLKEVNLRLAEEVKKQHEAEQKVMRALDKEKDLSDLKSRFISTASHEFRTPLTTILSSVELLDIFRQKDDNEKFKIHFNKIRKSVRFLTSLIEDVLISEKVNSSKIGFNPEDINLYDLAFYTFEEISLLANKKHKCIFEPKIKKNEILYVDQKLIKLMITNLLSNAIKYSPDGGKVSLEIASDDKFILIKVSDEGKGISTDVQKHIFEQFHRGDGVEGIQGTGLGLSIVKKSVELHNGTIKVNSEVNKGSIFLISIPIIKKEVI